MHKSVHLHVFVRFFLSQSFLVIIFLFENEICGMLHCMWSLNVKNAMILKGRNTNTLTHQHALKLFVAPLCFLRVFLFINVVPFSSCSFLWLHRFFSIMIFLSRLFFPLFSHMPINIFELTLFVYFLLLN